MTGRVVSARRPAESLEEVPPSQLDDMERRTRAMLYAIWRAQGLRYKIVKMESNGHFEDIEEMLKDE